MNFQYVLLCSLLLLTFLTQSCYLDRWPLGGRLSDSSDAVGKEPTGTYGDAAIETNEDDSSSGVPSERGGAGGRSIGLGGSGGRVVENAGGSGGSNSNGGTGAGGAGGAGGNETRTDTVIEEPEQERPKTSDPVAYGEWNYYEVDGSICRDGSPAGYYLKKGVSKNLMVFLNGGGACFNDLFCNSNPANVNESLPGESLMDATVEMFTQAMAPVRQTPPNEGILKKDARNPVADWTMVYVPYCTGDVYAGTTRDATVITSTSLPPQQFVGYTNIGLFYRSFGPDFKDAPIVLLTGSSAGGFGVQINFDRTQKYFKNSKVIGITDSGIPFGDKYQELCLQKIWREIWGLDKVLPADCKECFHADGGGFVELEKYLVIKYGGRVVIGGISSKQDEIMKLFYSAGLNNCSVNMNIESMAALAGRGSYPFYKYPLGLQDYFDNVIGRQYGASYVMDGTTHQHIFRSRFYDTNGLTMSIADWVKEIISDHAVQLGTLP